MLRLFAVAALLALAVGCTNPNLIIQKSNNVKNGDTEQQVIYKMGQPQSKQFNGLRQAWQYCMTDAWGTTGSKYVIIWLERGVVYGVSTYSVYNLLNCEANFQRIVWETLPDKTYELRNR
jgi:hypothetical protein